MLSREDNALLTRVGPGTAMGVLFRRHWLPFMLADELVAEAPPQRLRLLGEPLVAFRDGRGRAGLLGEHCPHRRASLALGRNEAGGLRCAYHGWKFDVAGRCLEMPSEPAGSAFRETVRAEAYAVTERAGLLWAYLGPSEKRAELPELEWLGLPAVQRHASRRVQDCNYAQALEGEIDESRMGIAALEDPAPRYTVHETPYGLACGARRSAPADRYRWRINLILMPCFTLVPPADDAQSRQFRAWVPQDDEHTSVLSVTWRNDAPLGERERDELKSSEATHRALAQSAGPVADRTLEHLGTSDKALIAFRERLLGAARMLAEGIEPQTPYDPDCYRVRAHASLVPRDERDFNEQEEIRRAMLAP
ncbi:MAG: Rieske 2Fe-2S domain-containing protein [Burkholderiales bacterium]